MHFTINLLESNCIIVNCFIVYYIVYYGILGMLSEEPTVYCSTCGLCVSSNETSGGPHLQYHISRHIQTGKV